MRFILAISAALIASGCGEEVDGAIVNGMGAVSNSRQPAPMYMPGPTVVSSPVLTPQGAPSASAVGASPFIQNGPTSANCVRIGNTMSCRSF